MLTFFFKTSLFIKNIPVRGLLWCVLYFNRTNRMKQNNIVLSRTTLFDMLLLTYSSSLIHPLEENLFQSIHVWYIM